MNSISAISVVPTWLWIAFSLGVFILLAIDLSLFRKSARQNSLKIALMESAFWIGIALIFNIWISYVYGKEIGIEFLTGYLIEKSLSIDNIFIMLLIFSTFRIPDQYQHRVLFYGVLGAIVFRAVLIIIGANLLHEFHWLLYFFGGALVVTAINFLRQKNDHQNFTDHWFVKTIGKVLPSSKNFKVLHQ